MYATFLLTLAVLGLATFAGIVEASRRHVVCVRFEHDLRRSIEESRNEST